MSFTIAYITSRNHPRFDWFFDSLRRQHGVQNIDQVIVVDLFAGQDERRVQVRECAGNLNLLHVEPKPSIWQGKHRITKDDWWNASGSRNTAFALCRSEWIAFLDDRCVLQPGWVDTVMMAIRGGYIVAGAYEKRVNMVAVKGVIADLGVAGGPSISGSDSREAYCKSKKTPMPFKCGGEWLFGCNFALPLVCGLQVNGFPEDYCDGVSMEDVIFGMILFNAGFKLCYDHRMKMIEDRTPGETGPTIHRKDKGVSPKDKTHKLLEVFKGAKTSKNSYNLSLLRQKVLRGEPFPMPTAKTVDWYDSQPIKDFTP